MPRGVVHRLGIGRVHGRAACRARMVALVKRRSALPGPEWDALLLVLAVLAALAVLATFSWWLGVLGIFGLFVGLCVYAFMAAP